LILAPSIAIIGRRIRSPPPGSAEARRALGSNA
jgi:hypothetical protein